MNKIDQVLKHCVDFMKKQPPNTVFTTRELVVAIKSYVLSSDPEVDDAMRKGQKLGTVQIITKYKKGKKGKKEYWYSLIRK